MGDAISVEQRRTAFDAMYFVAFLEQKLRDIGAVLARDPRDQSPLSLRLRRHAFASSAAIGPAGREHVTASRDVRLVAAAARTSSARRFRLGEEQAAENVFLY